MATPVPAGIVPQSRPAPAHIDLPADPNLNVEVSANPFRFVDKGLLIIQLAIAVDILAFFPMCLRTFDPHPILQAIANLINVVSAAIITLGMVLCVQTPTAKPLALIGLSLQALSLIGGIGAVLLTWPTQPPASTMGEAALSIIAFLVGGVASFLCFMAFLWFLARSQNDNRLCMKVVQYLGVSAVAFLVLMCFGLIIALKTQRLAEPKATGIMIWYVLMLLVATCFLAWLIGLVHSVRLSIGGVKDH